MAEQALYTRAEHGKRVRYDRWGTSYDMSALSQGAHLVIISGNWQSRCKMLDCSEEAARMEAVLRRSEDAVRMAIYDGSRHKLTKDVTPEQRKLWDQLVATGFDESSISSVSPTDVIDAIMRMLRKELAES